MKYITNSFDTVHAVRDIFKYSFNEISLFTDYILFFSSTVDESGEYIFTSPQNIYYSDLEDGNMIIFWGSEKAVKYMNTIGLYKGPIESLEQANSMSKGILGFSFDFYLKMSFEDVDKHIEKLKEAKESKESETIDEVIDVYKKLAFSDEYFTNFLIQIQNNIGKQIKTRRGTMEFNPKFKAKNIVVKKNQAFYVLPFSEGPLNAYQAIKDGVSNEKIDCMIIKSEDRFDPSRGNNIIENIWQDICASHFIIADLSEKNPNVYYELGICDAIGKTVIPICSNKSLQNDYSDKLPFDISGGYTIFYDENYSGIEKLKKDVNQRIKAILTGSTVEIE